MCAGGGRCGLHKDDRFIHDREERNKREDCVCVGGVEDVAYTRTTDLFMTERKEIRGRIVCVWGGGDGRCGLHKDEIIIYNREGRNKEGDCVCRGGGG